MNPNFTPTTWMDSAPQSYTTTTISDTGGHLKCHPRYPQNDAWHDAWKDDDIHQPQIINISPTTSLHHEQQEQYQRKQPPKSIPSLPHQNFASEATATTPSVTTSSVSVSLPLLLSYPTLDDIPEDISVDEIFQQTNIVMGRRPFLVEYQDITNVHPVDKVGKNTAPCKINNDDHDHSHNSDYYDSNHYNLDYNIHPNIDDIDEEEAAYRYQTNSWQKPEAESYYYHDGHYETTYNDENTDAERDYVEDYAVLPQLTDSKSYGYEHDFPNVPDETQWDVHHRRQPQHHHHHHPHSEIVPVVLPELDETSGHSSTHQDDDYHQYHDNYCTPSDQIEAQCRSEPEPIKRIPTIEISPGKFLPLRGAKETMYAIECGFCVTIPCSICDQALICIANCELVLCPTCRIVSPNTATMLKHTTTRSTMNDTEGFIMNEDEDGIVLRLDVKSGVGLGLEAT